MVLKSYRQRWAKYMWRRVKELSSSYFLRMPAKVVFSLRPDGNVKEFAAYSETGEFIPAKSPIDWRLNHEILNLPLAAWESPLEYDLTKEPSYENTDEDKSPQRGPCPS